MVVVVRSFHKSILCILICTNRLFLQANSLTSAVDQAFTYPTFTLPSPGSNPENGDSLKDINDRVEKYLMLEKSY